MSNSTRRADIDHTCGTGRSMACRPVRAHARKRFELRRIRRAATRCNRVSAKRSVAFSNCATGSQENSLRG